MYLQDFQCTFKISPQEASGLYENTHSFVLLILPQQQKAFASLVVEEISILPSFIFYFIMKIYILNGFCQFSFF